MTETAGTLTQTVKEVRQSLLGHLWTESEHPRGYHGRFAHGAGGVGGALAVPHHRDEDHLPEHGPGGARRLHSSGLPYIAPYSRPRGRWHREVVTEAEQAQVKVSAIAAIERATGHPAGPEVTRSGWDGLRQQYLTQYRSKLRAVNAEVISRRTGGIVSPEAAVEFQDEWSRSTGAEHSLALAEAIQEKFGYTIHDTTYAGRVDDVLEDLSANQYDRLLRAHPESLTTDQMFALHNQAYADADAEWRQRIDQARSFADVQYEMTQQYFKEHGIRQVTLFRGMSFHLTPEEDAQGYGDDLDGPTTLPFDPKDLGPADRDGYVHNATMSLYPLSSWSGLETVADSFADEKSHHVVLAATVPVERIFGNGVMGIGAIVENEHVLIGLPEWEPVSIKYASSGY